MKKFAINLNSKVKVKLTKAGVDVLRTHYMMYRLPGAPQFKVYTDKDGYYVATLWQLMKAFGGCMLLNSPSLFEGDLVLIDEDQFKD